MKAKTTYHAQERVKDRMGLSKKLADQKAQEALEMGVSHQDLGRGSLHKYLTALYHANQKANNIRIYNRFVYLFADNVVITVLHLPRQYHVKADKAQKLKNEVLIS